MSSHLWGAEDGREGRHTENDGGAVRLQPSTNTDENGLTSGHSLSAFDDEHDTFFHIKSCEDYRSLMSSFPVGDDTSVVNLSDMVLKESHISLLSKGLSFCPTLDRPDLGELKRDMDIFHHSPKLRAHFQEGDTTKLPPKKVGCPLKSASMQQASPCDTPASSSLVDSMPTTMTTENLALTARQHRIQV